MGKITSIILLLFLILLLSEASKAMTCEDLFRENEGTSETTVEFLGKMSPLYSHRASEQSGIERMSFVGKSSKIRIDGNETIPEQTINLEIENILSSTGAGQTRLQLNVGSQNQILSFISNQLPKIYVSAGIRVKRPRTLAYGRKLTEVYRINSEMPKGVLVIQVQFIAIGESARIMQISTIDGKSRMARSPQEPGKAADWQLVGATLHFKKEK